MKLNRAVELHGAGELGRASLLYAEILEDRPNHPDALHLFGVTETQFGRAESGLAWIAKSLRVNPNQPAALSNQGNALLALNRASEALESYEKALNLLPDYLLAVLGRGDALAALGRPGEALPNFDRALELAPNFLPALGGRGSALQKLKRHAESLAAFDQALELAPTLAEAHLGKGTALLSLGEPVPAMRCIDRALELKPGYADAMLLRGHAWSDQGNAEAAIDAYDRALDWDPALAAAWFSRGLALSTQGRYPEAAESLRHALGIDPAYPYARGAWLHAKLQVADWRDYAAITSLMVDCVERDERTDFPFSFLAVCDSPPLQLKCARRFAAQGTQPMAPIIVARSLPERIRVAYISADFLEHPTSYLMAGVFERHDRERFEVIGISLRSDQQSPTARRVKSAFDRWISAESHSDARLAQMIRDLHVDIAVDLMGYTAGHRAGLFGFRPAPLQVNYLGYPATTGSPSIDYILADEFLITDVGQRNFSEHIAYLPECFQANDHRRVAAPDAPTRAQANLPPDGLVWCSFHSTYKLNPPVFDIWCRLLLAVPGSVLWLLGGTPDREDNLRRHALARGVDPARLVFAQSEPYARHLARLRLADVCLDTYPFNGGATTSDALWAGVPVITVAGASYASRMSGSLLTALGLGCLVASSLEDYETLALQLAGDANRLEITRARLGRTQRSSAVFDTDRFCRHIEAAFTAMVARHRSGAPPATFRVAPLSEST